MGLIITLILIGLLLLIAELLIIPGFGIAGVLGVAAIAGSVVMAFLNHGTVVGFIVLFGALFLCGLLIFFVLRSKTWKKLTLHQKIDEKANTLPQEMGMKPGMEGIALSNLRPSGSGRFGEVTLEVYALQGMIESNTPIIIHHIDGLRVFVTTKTN